MYCKNCGKEINDNAYVCPNCGVKTESALADNSSAAKKTNVLAIVGFVLSFFIPIAGLICSILGMKKASEFGGKGHGLALAGVIISAVSMAIILIVVIIEVALIGAAVSAI